MSYSLTQQLLGEDVDVDLPEDGEAVELPEAEEDNFDSTTLDGIEDGKTLNEEDSEDIPQEDLPDDEEDDVDAIAEAALLSFAFAQERLAESMALTESKTVIRFNRQARLKNLTNRSALVFARRANDPLYKKYSKHNALRLRLRGAIVKKYGSRASSYARKLLNKTAPEE